MLQRWIDVPTEGHVVFWTGEVILVCFVQFTSERGYRFQVARKCNPKCAVGVHRVDKPASQAPRTAVWAEITTRSQLLPALNFYGKVRFFFVLLARRLLNRFAGAGCSFNSLGR